MTIRFSIHQYMSSIQGRITFDDPLHFYPTVGPCPHHTSIQMGKSEMEQANRDAMRDDKVGDVHTFGIGALAASAGADHFVDNFSLFTKHSQDSDENLAGPLSVGERSQALNWAMSVQALQGNQQLLHQVMTV